MKMLNIRIILISLFVLLFCSTILTSCSSEETFFISNKAKRRPMLRESENQTEARVKMNFSEISEFSSSKNFKEICNLINKASYFGSDATLNAENDIDKIKIAPDFSTFNPVNGEWSNKTEWLLFIYLKSKSVYKGEYSTYLDSGTHSTYSNLANTVDAKTGFHSFLTVKISWFEGETSQSKTEFWKDSTRQYFFPVEKTSATKYMSFPFYQQNESKTSPLFDLYLDPITFEGAPNVIPKAESYSAKENNCYEFFILNFHGELVKPDGIENGNNYDSNNKIYKYLFDNPFSDLKIIAVKGFTGGSEISIGLYKFNLKIIPKIKDKLYGPNDVPYSYEYNIENNWNGATNKSSSNFSAVACNLLGVANSSKDKIFKNIGSEDDPIDYADKDKALQLFNASISKSDFIYNVYYTFANIANSYNINSYSSKQNNPISEFDLKISGFTIKENDKISAANNSLFFQDKSTKLINFKTIEINFYKKFDMKKLYSTIKIDSTISFDIAGFGYVAFNDAKNIFSQYDVSVDASDTAAALPLACFGEIHTKDLNSTEEDPEDGKISKDSENFKITISTVGDEVKTLGVSALALLISPNTIGNSLTNFSGWLPLVDKVLS